MLEMIILTSSLVPITAIYFINIKDDGKIPFSDNLKKKKYV